MTLNIVNLVNNLWANLHTRLRARDHYTLSTLIGGKGGAGPSSLYTTLEGPLHGFLHGIEWTHVSWSLGYLEKPPLGGRPNTLPRDHGTPKVRNR